MLHLFARPAHLSPIIALVLLGLAGCGKVPMSTQWKLRSFDALTFDPAEPRAAIIITERLRALPGGAKLLLRHWVKGDEANKREEVFVLQETPEFPPPAVMDKAATGQRVTVFRLSQADVQRVRRLQAAFAERKRSAPNTTGAEIKADISACRTDDLPAGAILGTLFLKLDSANDYLPFLTDMDVREMAAAEGSTLEAEAKPCPHQARRS